MRNIAGLFWSLFGLALILACVAGFYNVLSDNFEVTRMAQQAACEDAVACRAQMTAYLRTPIAQSFDFATPKRPSVHVRCVREWIFVGAYSCTRSDVDVGAFLLGPSFPAQVPASSSRTTAPPARSSAPPR